MNKKIVMWTAVMALVSGSALNLMAQEGPGEEEEVEMPESGPEQPGIQPGMDRGRDKMRPGMRDRMGSPEMMMKKKMMRERKREGDPGFMPENEILAVITKHDPVFAKKVEGLREIAPAKYRMLLQISGKMFGLARMEQDESIEKDVVRAVSLEFESKELSLKYDKASDDEKKTIKESLKGKLSELFDLRTRGQELRVKHMEREMGKLRKDIESRKAGKSKIVEQRLEQMTGEGQGW